MGKEFAAKAKDRQETHTEGTGSWVKRVGVGQFE
jgi:hypothetical protein